MQQPINTNPVQVVMVAQPMSIDKQSSYKDMKNGLAKQLIGLGAAQVVIGVLCIIFQAVGVGLFANNYFFSLDPIGHGFWTGILFIITGAFGLAGGSKRNRCQVLAFNVLSILSSTFAACLIGIAIPGALFYVYRSYGCDYDNYYGSSRCINSRVIFTGTAMQGLLAILGLIEGIIAIWSSVICCTIGACCCTCGGSCCCPPSPLHNQFVMTGQPYPGQQQMIMANHQQLGSSQPPQIFLTDQPPSFPPNQQQPMFSPNHRQQQPLAEFNSQQPNINLNPRQHMAQYLPQQPNAPNYSQQSIDYTALSPDLTDQRSYTGLYTGLTNTNMTQLQHARSDGTTSAYDYIQY